MRSYLTELLGSFFVVFAVLSTTVVSATLSAVSVGVVLVAAVWTGAHVSGGHFNPAVTLGVFLRGGLSLLDLWCYWAAQLTGALVASVVGLGVLRVGGPTAVPDAAVAAVAVVEFVFSFALVYVVLTIGASRRQEHNMFLGLAVGVVVLAGMLAVTSMASAAFNPAVAFGLSVDGALGWQSVWAYVVAQLAGGAAAAAAVTRTQPAPH